MEQVLCVQIFASVTDQICPEGSSILIKPCLHLSDISRLMKIMNHFVEQGNTLVVIEHHLEIIRPADWIIDRGPEESAGAEVIYAGPSAGLRNCSASLTAQYI